MTAALVVSLALLLLSLGYYLLAGRTLIPKFLYPAWTPREQVKDWFLYLSITTGVIGIVSTILSIAIPLFLPLTLSLFIPIAFDTISVLSALLEFTLYVPPYHTILSLIYKFTLHANVSQDTGEPYVEDIDFSNIAEGTTYTNFEIRDAMEVLTTMGFASKVSPTPLGKVGFKLNEYGVKFLQAVWNEIYVQLNREKDRIESEVLYLLERLHSSPGIDKNIVKRARDEIKTLVKRMHDISGDYGIMLEQSWKENLQEKLSELEKSIDGKEKLVKNEVKSSES